MLDIEKIEKLSRENLSPLTLLTGDDEGQYGQLKEKLFSQLAFDAGDLSLSYFDLRETAYQEASLDLESLPFFADDKLVFLDYLLDLTTSKKRLLSDEELKRLEAYLKSPLDSTKLIILAPGKLDSKRRIVKLLKRDAQIFEANQIKEEQLRPYFKRQAELLGLNLNQQVLEETLIKSNFDFNQIQKNLSLLAAYKGKERVTSADIAEVLPKTLQDNIFDLTQLILRGQVDQARSLVRDLTLQGEEEIKLIAVMLNQFRLFSQIKILQKQGRADQELVAVLSDILGRKVNPYQITFALRDSRGLDLDSLKKAVSLLIETDFQIKSGLHDKAYLFDLLMLKLANLQSPAGKR